MHAHQAGLLIMRQDHPLALSSSTYCSGPPHPHPYYFVPIREGLSGFLLEHIQHDLQILISGFSLLINSSAISPLPFSRV